MSVSNAQQKAGRKASQSVLTKSTPDIEGTRTPHLPGVANDVTPGKIDAKSGKPALERGKLP